MSQWASRASPARRAERPTSPLAPWRLRLRGCATGQWTRGCARSISSVAARWCASRRRRAHSTWCAGGSRRMAGKRLFIAVDIDAATRVQVDRISSMLRSKLDTAANASWVCSDRMHLTLHFVGSADAAVERQVRAVLARPISQAPFDVAFDGLGCFPHRGTPRVLWLGISAGVDALRRLHTAFDVSALPGLLPKCSDEPFTPHLTLARFR